MKFWPFGAAVVFLVAVLFSACNSYLLGNEARVKKGKWMTPRSGRRRELLGIEWERLHLRRDKREKPCLESEKGCCTKCPAGMFLKDCTCETCGDETYAAYPNSRSKCDQCDQCGAQQVVVKECAPKQKRECKCQRGFYRIKDDADPEDFFCRPCSDCTGPNKLTENCSETSRAECADCLPGFKKQGDECQKDTKEQPQDFRKTAYLLLCLPCLLFLGACITYCKRRRISGNSSPVGIHTLVNSACVETLLAAAGTAASPKPKLEEPMGIPLSISPPRAQCSLLHTDPSAQRPLLQGRKLYSIIDAVPVRRWKEFMRGLGLRDGEIEAVEVEHTQLREQQYEMLKRWRQQRGATMDAILAVLEDMQLGGCAQELREKLQSGSLLPAL
ncbi:tumor necrosis factor receptor superfamily member 25 [Paroedura picta]|uniref:tumor necrosis factor receptor superfamily member 25 n=1 Tax=Paroedura picta TaxID=143630 RepID=UPI004056AA55